MCIDSNISGLWRRLGWMDRNLWKEKVIISPLTFDLTSGYSLLDHLWPHHHFPFDNKQIYVQLYLKKKRSLNSGGEIFLTKIFLCIGRCAGCMHNIHNVHIAYCIICGANIPAIPLQSNRKGVNFIKPGDGGGNHSCCTHCKQYLISIQIESRQITHRTWFATKMMMANHGGKSNPVFCLSLHRVVFLDKNGEMVSKKT